MIINRYLKEPCIAQKDLAKTMKVSHQRISQIEMDALNNLKRFSATILGEFYYDK